MKLLDPGIARADDTGMESSVRALMERLAWCAEDQLVALRTLCFKCETQHAVLTSCRQRWLEETTRELTQAIEAVGARDRTLRAALVSAAEAAGLPPDATLGEVASRVPEPWSYVLSQLRNELVETARRVDELSSDNRRLLAAGHAAATTALSALTGLLHGGYDSTGAPARVSGSVGLVDTRA